MKKSLSHEILRMLPYFTFLYFLIVFTIFNGNRWVQVKSLADDQAVPSLFFQPFQTSDWIGLGLTALADTADMDSSYAGMLTDQQKNQLLMSTYKNYTLFKGEGNPLITGLFGTRFPTAIEYAGFGALELAVQSLVAYALPEKYRGWAWGLYIGIGATDTISNGYRGGVVFRF